MNGKQVTSWAVFGVIVVASSLALATALKLLRDSEGERVQRRTLPAPGTVSGLSYDGETLWTTVEETGVLYQLDPETAEVRGQRKLPWTSTAGSAWDGHHLWQMAWEENVIYKLQLPEAKVVGSIPTPGKGFCAGLTFDGDYLWVGNWDDHLIFRVDQNRQGAVLATYKGNYETTGLAWDGRRLWTGLLIGTQYHGEVIPETAFIQRWLPETSSTEVIDTDMVLAVDGVGPGTSNWLPGVKEADRFWWYDAFNENLVVIDISRAPIASLRMLTVLLCVLSILASALWLFAPRRSHAVDVASRP